MSVTDPYTIEIIRSSLEAIGGMQRPAGPGAGPLGTCASRAGRDRHG